MAPLTGKRVAIRLQDKDQGEGQGTRHAFPTLVRREPRAHAAQEVPHAVLVELASRGGVAGEEATLHPNGTLGLASLLGAGGDWGCVARGVSSWGGVHISKHHPKPSRGGALRGSSPGSPLGLGVPK